MILRLLVIVMIAVSAAVIVPRDLTEVAALAVRAGVALINLGVVINPLRYDAGQRDEPAIEEDTEEAALRHVMPAEFFPDTPVPNRPGCVVTYCVPITDGYRRGERCFWRCRRARPRFEHYHAPPEEEPTPPRYVPPSRTYDADSSSLRDFLAGFLPRGPETRTTIAKLFIVVISIAVIAAAVGGLITVLRMRFAVWQHRRDEVLRHTRAAKDLNQRINDIAREADAFIRAYRAEHYRRGHDD